MFRKNYFVLLSAFAVVLLSSVFASAQIVNITGTVQMTKEDGTTAPVEGALVEIYRTDTTAGNKSDKTDTKGAFIFAGVPPGAKYLLTVSAPNIEPVIVPISSGMLNQVLTVKPGDGMRWTEEDVRAAPTNSANSAELTADQKKKQEELEKERARIEEKNKKVEESNAVVQRVLKEGNDAFNAKNYDVAIVKYEEGYQALPEFVGSAPVLLNNKAIALKTRAVDNYNKAVKDKSMAAELLPKVKKDINDAVEALGNSWKVLSKGAGEAEPKTFEANKQKTLEQSQILFDVMLQMNLSPQDKKEAVSALTKEYVKVESDKAKKAEAYVNLGQYYSDVYDYENSINAFKDALNVDSSNAEALGRLTLALYTQSSVVSGNGDAAAAKKLKQESVNYGQKYLDVAAKNHSLRDGIAAVVDDIKKTDKLSPQKIN